MMNDYTGGAAIGRAPGPAPTHDVQRPEAELRAVAVKLEATFLSQMLKSAGLEGISGAFGGGAGEDQVASFLRDAQARHLAEAGGIGLAESIFQALVARQNDG